MEKRPMLAIVLLLILPWVNSFVLKKQNGEKDPLKQDDKPQTENIDEIANREYETEHGRIIAVNMAHLKRQAARMKRESVFKEIETNNEEKHLKLYQGDIQLDPELEQLLRIKKEKVKRNAIREKKRLWNTRMIPYFVPSEMSHIIPNLNEAIKSFHKYTCLRFVPYDYTQRNYILFGNKDGCSSMVGMRYHSSGPQALSLGEGCDFVGTIIHELMHAIGFFHEQSRPDRDKFVKIYWENILQGFSEQFDKYSWRTIDDLGKDYDYESIMHYDRRAFTKNGSPTIVNIYNEAMEFGNKEKRLSKRDIIEINTLYDCHTTTHPGWSSWSAYTPCDENCYKSRERYCYNNGNLQSCQGSPNIYGIEKQTTKCSDKECYAIDGHWGRWSDWSSCSVTCGDGYRKRYRKCDNPAPVQGGLNCPGSSTEADGCVMRRCTLEFDDTDFESNLGMWTNAYDDKLNWQRHSGYTQTLNTGPSSDHTLGTSRGVYLYVESSAPAQSNDNAKLISPWLNPVSGGQCLKFYYNMYGSTTGELMVRIEPEGKKSYLLFYEKGNKGMGWKGVTKDIEAGVRYRLTIEARIGGTGYSDTAIDDVFIDPGHCGCQDTYYSGCPKWAAAGDCKSNEKWMKDFCKKSCNSCPISCLDSDVTNCPRWAIQGECDTNPWMKDNCKKSCGVCGCKDESSSCPTWSSRAYCETNSDFMLATCALSCKVCACKDLSPSCPSWAEQGECGKNPSYMLDNCCRSCRCKNWVKDGDCSAWASAGYCNSNPSYMLINCKESCAVC